MFQALLKKITRIRFKRMVLHGALSLDALVYAFLAS